MIFPRRWIWDATSHRMVQPGWVNKDWGTGNSLFNFDKMTAQTMLLQFVRKPGPRRQCLTRLRGDQNQTPPHPLRWRVNLFPLLRFGFWCSIPRFSRGHHKRRFEISEALDVRTGDLFENFSIDSISAFVYWLQNSSIKTTTETACLGNSEAILDAANPSHWPRRIGTLGTKLVRAPVGRSSESTYLPI